MESITQKQFERRHVAGFIPATKNRDAVIQIKQQGGGVADVEVGSLNRQQAVDRFYREYLVLQTHLMNFSKPKTADALYFTSPVNPMRHAGCDGKVAFEVGEISDMPPTGYPNARRGFCQGCGVAGWFVEPEKVIQSVRLIVAEDRPDIPRIWAKGIVESATSFRMMCDDVLDFAQRAEHQMMEENPAEVEPKNIMVILHRDNVTFELQGIPLYILRDYCDVLDPGTVITAKVNPATWELEVTHTGSRVFLKMNTPRHQRTITKGSGKKKTTSTINVVMFPCAFDFEGSAEPVEDAKLDKWIAKALPSASRKADLLEEDRTNLLFHWGDLATDGFRLHLDSSLSRRNHPKGETPPDLEYIIKGAKALPVLAEFDTKEFTKFVTAAKRIGKTQITLEFGDDEITFVATGKNIEGEPALSNRSSMKWKRLAPIKEKVVIINPTFLHQSISGMGKTFSMRVGSRYVSVESGTRIAVISRMNKE